LRIETDSPVRRYSSTLRCSLDSRMPSEETRAAFGDESDVLANHVATCDALLPAVRNVSGGDGNVGIIRNAVRAITLLEPRFRAWVLLPFML